MGLDTVELVMAIEEEFEVAVPDAQAEKIVTVADLVDFVEVQLVAKGQAREREGLERAVQEIIVDQLGVPLEACRMEAEIVRDLGAD